MIERNTRVIAAGGENGRNGGDDENGRSGEMAPAEACDENVKNGPKEAATPT